MKKPEPMINQEDIKVAGVVEEILRTSVIQEEGLIHDHVIHISVAPIRVPVAEQKEGNDQSKQNQAQGPVPGLHVPETLKSPEFLRLIPHNPKRHRCPRSKLRFRKMKDITALRFRRARSSTPQLPKASHGTP